MLRRICRSCCCSWQRKSSLVDEYAELGCSVLAFVLYLNTLNAGFVYDDRRAILGNMDVTLGSPLHRLLQHDYWGTALTDSGSHGSWRPLCVLSFRLNFLLGGFHLTNVLLHCLATALVVRLARTLLPTLEGVLAAGSLFAAHPVHTEAVAGLVGRADLAACVCYLLTYLAYRQHMHWRSQGQQRQQWLALLLTLLLACAALLCKETAITALLICGLGDVLRHADKHRLRSLAILTAALVCALYCRLSLLARPQTAFSSADNPAAQSSSWWTRTLTFLYLPVCNFRLLLWPQVLSFDWGMDAIPRVTTLWDARNLLTAGFYGLLLLLLWQGARQGLSRPPVRRSVDYAALASLSISWPLLRSLGGRSCYGSWPTSGMLCNACQHHQLLLQRATTSVTATPTSASSTRKSGCHVVLMSCAFLVLPFVPACNLFFYVGFVLAERLLYLPSVGYCLLMGYGFGRLLQHCQAARSKLLLLCCFGLLLSVFSLRTWQRNLDWYNEEQLYRSAVPVNPPKALGNLGSVLSSQGRYEEAKLALNMAIAYRPSMADAHFNLGIVHQQQRNYSGALPCYRRAIHLRPQLATAYLNLGISLLALERHDEAAEVLLEGARLDGHGVRDRSAHERACQSAYLQLGALYRSQDKPQRALMVYREALESLPRDHQQRAVVHQRLGDVFGELQQWDAAEWHHRAALQLQPQQGAVYVSYGLTLARNSSRYAEAEQWFKRALQLSPAEPSAHHHYADFLDRQERPREALVYHLRAAALAPTDYALVAAVADALRLLNRLSEAELWYRKAATLRPLAAHAHANLGAILQMRGLKQQAVDCYHEALRLQPGHATSRANLAKLNVDIDTSA